MILLVFSVMIAVPPVQAAGQEEFATTPSTNNGTKWRIGLYQGGKYADYSKTLVALVNSLMILGWIETAEIPSAPGDQTKPVWNWLVHEAKSRYIQFVSDAFYSALWDSNIRYDMVPRIIRRLNQTKDIDLMIALGTWAGQDLANSQHNTPVVVFSSSDAVASGIVKSLEDSGFDHVLAHVDPMRHERQLRIFQKFVGFKKLGVAFENTVPGRSIAAIKVIERLAPELGFETVKCFTKDDNVDLVEAEKSVRNCFEELAIKADAIYLTTQNGVNNDSLPELVKIANKHRIPTFSQSGSHEVRRGILLSMSRPGFQPIGMYQAKTIAKILNGAKPRQLTQIFEESPNIAVNLKTVEIIQLYLQADLIGAADEIYRSIK